jgi:flagellar hook-length control protein FliK
MQVMISQPAMPLPVSSSGDKQTAGTANLFSQLLASSDTSNAESGNGIGAIIQALLKGSDGIDLLSNSVSDEIEDIQAILAELPPEVKELLEDKLKESIDAESILVNPTPEMKIIFLLQVVQQEQNQQLTEPVKKEIKAMIEKWFPTVKLESKDTLTKQVQQIFEEVTKQMNGQEKQDKNAFSKVLENLTSVKKVQSYVEQAFQRYVPVKQTDQKSSGTKELQSFQSALSPLEQWSLKVPDSQEDGQKQQFVREIQQIINRGKLVVTDTGFAKMQIRLNPEHLGNIEIQLIQKQGEIVAKIVASSHAAKDAIDSQLSQLKHAFAGQNIEFEKIEVFFQGEEQTFTFHDQGNQSQGEQSQSEQNSRDENETSPLTFEEQLSQLFLNEKV